LVHKTTSSVLLALESVFCIFTFFGRPLFAACLKTVWFSSVTLSIKSPQYGMSETRYSTTGWIQLETDLRICFVPLRTAHASLVSFSPLTYTVFLAAFISNGRVAFRYSARIKPLYRGCIVTVPLNN